MDTPKAFNRATDDVRSGAASSNVSLAEYFDAAQECVETPGIICTPRDQAKWCGPGYVEYNPRDVTESETIELEPESWVNLDEAWERAPPKS